MIRASSSRGFQTYRCARGCADSYEFTYESYPLQEVKHEVNRTKDLSVLQLSLIERNPALG
jgi:hypothetical protein